MNFDIQSRSWQSWLFLCCSLSLSKRIFWDLCVKHIVYSVNMGFAHIEFILLAVFAWLNLTLQIKIFIKEFNQRFDSKYVLVMIGQLIMIMILGVVQLSFNMSPWDHKQFANEFLDIDAGRFFLDALMLIVCILARLN